MPYSRESDSDLWMGILQDQFESKIDILETRDTTIESLVGICRPRGSSDLPNASHDNRKPENYYNLPRIYMDWVLELETSTCLGH